MFEKERKEIDEIDYEIVILLKRRQEIVKRIIAKKKRQGITLKDSPREKEIISKLKKICDDELVEKVYKEIFSSVYNWPILKNRKYYKWVVIYLTNWLLL